MPKIPSCSHARYACNRCRKLVCRPAAVSVSPGNRIIILLYFGQADTARDRRSISLENAQLLKLLRAGRFESNGTVFRLDQPAPAPERPFFACSKSPDSSESISFAEMKANVGITENQGEPDEPPLRHLVQRAQEKVRSVGRNDYTMVVKSRLANRSRLVLGSRFSALGSALSSQEAR